MGSTSLMDMIERLAVMGYKSLVPSNVRWLGQSMISPRAMTERDLTLADMHILSQAYTNSINRIGAMSPGKRQSLLDSIDTLKKLPPYQFVTGPDGVNAPAGEHIGLLRGYLSKSLQYPDYPPMRTKNEGIDSTPIFQNLTDPSYSMATTIGRAAYTQDQYGNTHIIDTYDFPGEDQGTSLFSKLLNAVQDRRFSMGIPEAIAAHYSKKMPVDVQITHGASGEW